MTRQDAVTLIDYHYWARDRMLEALGPITREQWTRDLGSSFTSIRDTAAHTYSAEWVWYMRWAGDSPTAPLPFERFDDVATLKAEWVKHEDLVRALVVAQTDETLQHEYDYTLMNGQPGRSVLAHMIQHVVNHASYHRGQITTMLRQLGMAAPKSMDLIAFYRDKL